MSTSFSGPTPHNVFLWGRQYHYSYSFLVFSGDALMVRGVTFGAKPAHRKLICFVVAQMMMRMYRNIILPATLTARRPDKDSSPDSVLYRHAGSAPALFNCLRHWVSRLRVLFQRPDK